MRKLLVIRPTASYTAQQRIDGINRELWRLCIPESVETPDQVTQKVFGQIEHPTTGELALIGDFTYEIVRYKDPTKINLTKLIQYIGENTTQQEIDALTAYVMATAKFPFQNIIPSISIVIDENQATQDGWFQNENV